MDSRWPHAVLLPFLSVIATSEGRCESEHNYRGLSKHKYLA